MDWQEIWDFVLKNSGAAGVVLVAGLALFGGLWKAYTHFFPKAGPATTIATDKIVDVLSAQLESASEREQEHRDRIQQLTEAVDALKVEGGKPDALPGIAEALDHLEKGDTAAAEAIFEEVKERRKAEGEGHSKRLRRRPATSVHWRFFTTRKRPSPPTASPSPSTPTNRTVGTGWGLC